MGLMRAIIKVGYRRRRLPVLLDCGLAELVE